MTIYTSFSHFYTLLSGFFLLRYFHCLDNWWNSDYVYDRYKSEARCIIEISTHPIWAKFIICNIVIMLLNLQLSLW